LLLLQQYRSYDGWADDASIPLIAHTQIQLDDGRPLVAAESIQFPNGL